MRLRVAVAMPEKGGRPAIVGAEVLRDEDEQGRRRWRFVVGHVERVASHTVEGTKERARVLAESVIDEVPCALVDIGTPQGFALRRSMRDGWPAELHRPHAYERTRFDTALFALFLEAYADGRVRFRDGLAHRKELDRALVLYRGGGVSKAGDELESEDEALVIAVSLAISMPGHGGTARRYVAEDDQP